MHRLLCLFGLVLSLGAVPPLRGAAPSPAVESPIETTWVEVAFDAEDWVREGVVASEVEHLGRACLLLEGGLFWLPDADFENGEIEFDIALPAKRTFVGVAWRIEDERNLEHFYMRPHQSGQPDSCQYTPVDHGSSAWQLFPEGGAAIEYEFDRWLSVRLVVWEDLLQVFVDSDEPRLVTRTRRDLRSGGVGLQVPRHFAPAHFSRFRYRALEEPPESLVSGLGEFEEGPPGIVTTWTVSKAFAASELADREVLPEGLLEGLTWSPLASEANGVTNLARLQGPQPPADTCLARLRLHADSARTVSVAFGFSDRVKVYQDLRLFFEGDDSYRSRDHRFLGTIGLHDRLTLRLHEGANELHFAVGESFGGWGLMAVVSPAPGVRVE